MNQAHYHLVLNHLPIIMPFIGLIIMVGGYLFRSEIVKRIAFFIFILGAIAIIPAFATGESAEDTIEQVQGIDEQYIETHEETAETFAILSYALGGLSLLGFWANYKQKSFTGIVTIIVIIFTFGVLFFAKQTGTTGGEIRHTEIRVNNDSHIHSLETHKSDDD